MESPLQFSIMYAAPETIRHYEAGATTVTADPAVDMWALGVIAFELLTGEPIFKPGDTQDSAMDKLSGRGMLPWEDPADVRYHSAIAHGRLRSEGVVACAATRRGAFAFVCIAMLAAVTGLIQC
jgi:serine/threonine protein kinase